MKSQTAIGGLLLVMLGAAWPGIAAEKPVTEDCAPSGELKFLCGMENPEDLAVLPGGRWIVASGMTIKSGLHLIDGKTKKWERWIAPVATSPRAPFDKCPSQPSPDELQLHGISLRDRGQGHATLYAVNHGGREEVRDLSVGGGRETIEVFDIDMRFVLTREESADGQAIARDWLAALARSTLEVRRRDAGKSRVALSAVEDSGVLPTDTMGLLTYVGLPNSPGGNRAVPGCLTLSALVTLLLWSGIHWFSAT